MYVTESLKYNVHQRVKIRKEKDREKLQEPYKIYVREDARNSNLTWEL